MSLHPGGSGGSILLPGSVDELHGHSPSTFSSRPSASTVHSRSISVAPCGSNSWTPVPSTPSVAHFNTLSSSNGKNLKEAKSVLFRVSERLDSGFGSRRSNKSQSSRSSKSSKGRLTKMGSRSLKEPSRYSTRWFLQKFVWIAKKFVESWQFTAVTMTLTIYALFGDDFRLAATHKSADIVFDVLTFVCIVVFVIEVLATCISKEDYMCSFFFWLDVLPTGTLILDLTFVADALFCSGVDGGSALKSGRAGRAGARAGRTVRIIRLIRLVKIYKLYVSAMEQREREKRKTLAASGDSKAVAPGLEDDLLGIDEDEESGEEDDSDLELDEDGKDGEQYGAGITMQELVIQNKNKEKETRVGKKLSEMTTRRVIVLVLVMLFGLPMFQYSTYGKDEMKSAASFGTELVYRKWLEWCPVSNSSSSPLPTCLWSIYNPATKTFTFSTSQQKARSWFERYLLAFIYMHHQSSFAWTLHWAGIRCNDCTEKFRSDGYSDPEGEVAFRIGLLAQLSNSAFVGANQMAVGTWDSVFADSTWVQEVEKLQQEVKNRLVLPWVQICKKFVGIALVADDVKPNALCTLDDDLRCSETENFVPYSKSDDDGLEFLFAFDKRATTVLEAGLSMIQTVFICLAVGIGAMTFSNDANQLLLHPIERMMAKLETIKDNPMQAMRLGDVEFRRQQVLHNQHKDKIVHAGFCRKCMYWVKQRNKVQEPMETIILEKTIIRLGGLLALCFGEEGGEVIANYIGDSFNTGSVDIMVAGHKVEAIIAFCQMRNVLPLTQALQEKVLIFVNMISQIVHLTVDEYSGAPNKNMGDSFLLAWRLTGMSRDDRRKITDMAIMACIRIVANISKSAELKDYTVNECVTDHFGHGDFRVEVGLGLHAGWAIEGASGSDYKIDASYLSPNVNLASRLQNATLHYGTSMLLSDVVVANCSPEMAQVCRLIDQVLSKARRNYPIRIYTVDLDTSLMSAERTTEKRKQNRFKLRQQREAHKAHKWAATYNVWSALSLDYDVVMMRTKYTDEFMRRFFTAYRNYEAGEWMVARDLFFTCHYQPKYHTPPVHVTKEDWPEDGPTRALLHFMGQHDFVAPADWNGFRELKIRGHGNLQ